MMAFNANTYRANKYARLSKENLADARTIKARSAAGVAYSWELDRVPSLAKLAIIHARLSRAYGPTTDKKLSKRKYKRRPKPNHEAQARYDEQHPPLPAPWWNER